MVAVSTLEHTGTGCGQPLNTGYRMWHHVRVHVPEWSPLVTLGAGCSMGWKSLSLSAGEMPGHNPSSLDLRGVVPT